MLHNKTFQYIAGEQFYSVIYAREARRSPIRFLIYVFSLRNTEKEGSASELVTGNTHPISSSTSIYVNIGIYKADQFIIWERVSL